MGKKLRTVSLNSKFTGSYKQKGVIVGTNTATQMLF